MTHLEFYEFCVNQHDVVCNQKYDNRHPYSFHLESVRNEAVKWKYVLNQLQPKEISEVLSGAIGHDLIEDARLTYNDIKDKVGVEVADIIYACTEEKGRSRKERHSDAYFQGLKENKLATFVKLCDIISNVKYSLLTNSSMLIKYRAEYSNVREKLFREEFEPMFIHLEKLFLV